MTLRIDLDDLLADLPMLVPLKRAASFFGVSERTMRSWRDAGRIHSFRTAVGRGGRVLFAKGEIRRLLEGMAQ